ncbi:Endonuclease Reverse transcriptase [Phytophthora megakarya]|uniref:Endonuclease Reverse transcriptase n=1 Tax=Phytophthora megakarya TaxID=4795 RepID=A0A225W5X9_9STRA|nr:Endonuclease Reverse transcriptase [Phytophthora megakarya]
MEGKYILQQLTTRQLVCEHFKKQFALPARQPIWPDPEARALDRPITADELAGADVLAPELAALLNAKFERGEPLDLGEGTSLYLPKPNKPRGECSSLRPIVLFNSIRKAISLLVLNRISPAVNGFLSPHQSGFRKARNTADAVWTHRWLCARTQRFKETIHVLGIDLSRVFDTIDRTKLIATLKEFLTDDEIRLIKLLLAYTPLALRVNGGQAMDPFESNTGTCQGDSLSPVLFVVYLEAALRDVAKELSVPYPLLEQMVVYADDADFICHDPAIIELVLHTKTGNL